MIDRSSSVGPAAGTASRADRRQKSASLRPHGAGVVLRGGGRRETVRAEKEERDFQRTIFAIGISRISSAPASFSCGISALTVPLLTTAWMLK